MHLPLPLSLPFSPNLSLFCECSVEGPEEVASSYNSIRSMFKVAQRSSLLQRQIGYACSGLSNLYFPPLSRELNDEILGAILSGMHPL